MKNNHVHERQQIKLKKKNKDYIKRVFVDIIKKNDTILSQ